MEFPDYLRLLRKRWLVIVLMVEAALLAAVVALMGSPPVFQSTAKLFVANPSTSGGADSPYQDSRFSRERIASYAELVEGATLATGVIERLGLPASTEQLQEQVTAVPVPQTVLLAVSVRDQDPTAAQRITQGYIDEIVELVPQLEGAASGILEVPVLVAEPAGVPVQVEPRPARALALGLAVGLLLGVGAAALRETLDDVIRTAEEVAACTGASPLVSLTPTRPAGGRLRRAVARPGIPARGDWAWLAGTLQFNEDPPQTVLLSSCVRADLSEAARGLARALAELDRRVLVVDVQPAAPTALALLGTAPSAAVEVEEDRLGRGQEADGAQGGGLHVLRPAARVAAPGAASVWAQQHLALRKDLYDLVVITAPPLLQSVDTARLAATVDATLLVVVPGRTTRRALRECLEVLADVRARLLGTAVLPLSEAREMRVGAGSRAEVPRQRSSDGRAPSPSRRP